MKKNMDINEWIGQRVKMIAEGFSLEQIQRECWDYCHREYLGILNLEAIIGRAMQLGVFFKFEYLYIKKN